MTPLLPAFTSGSLINEVHHTDLLTLCERVADAGIQVDCILADLPYGTTACSWDSIIPFDDMWKAFKRVIKPKGAIVLTASQPFTSVLLVSNIRQFRHEWIWEKDNATGHLNASKAPMKAHESALVFSESEAHYYPQFTKGKPYRATSGAAGGYVRDKSTAGHTTVNDGRRFPRSVIRFSSETGLHPTQKPVTLFRYLIRTYTRPGEVVLDPTCGSGTTAIAAREEHRRFIVGDLSEEYVAVTRKRLDAPYTPSFMNLLQDAG